MSVLTNTYGPDFSENLLKLELIILINILNINFIADEKNDTVPVKKSNNGALRLNQRKA